MPRRDGRGPQGEGPMTGGGFGPCEGTDLKGRGAGRRRSRGGCHGRRFKGGRGRGLGLGLGRAIVYDGKESEQITELQKQILDLTKTVSSLRTALTKTKAEHNASAKTSAGGNTDQ